MPHHAARSLALALVLAAPLLAGCRAGARVSLYADAPVVEEGVRIAVHDAYKRGDRLVVRANVVNRSGEALVVSRSDFALRLDDGSTIEARTGRRAARPITIARGEDARVTVEFTAPELREVSNATLLIAGTSFKKSDALAEVKLATAMEAKAFGKRRGAESADEATEDDAYDEDGEDVEEAPSEEASEPDEASEDDAGEDWVIGSE